MLQAQTQHVFSHQHQYPQADPSWMQHQQQQQHHQAQPHPHQSQQQHASLVAAQQHAQVQAAAAAAQQQHYGRIAMSGNGAGNPSQGAGGAGGMVGDGMPNSGSAMDGGISEENRKVFIWVAELLDPSRREAALMELSKKREQVPELALVIWHSFGMVPFLMCLLALSTITNGRKLAGVMTALLQEIISVYPLLNPSQLTAAASNRVCNALALLQCVASHNETRTLFLNGEQVIYHHTRKRLLIFSSLSYSSHPSFPLPLPQHYLQVSSLRIPPTYVAGRYWRIGEE
jgi:CCR4-NOT transcription complex subunit 9